jgi:hypothetical protein
MGTLIKRDLADAVIRQIQLNQELTTEDRKEQIKTALKHRRVWSIKMIVFPSSSIPDKNGGLA